MDARFDRDSPIVTQGQRPRQVCGTAAVCNVLLALGGEMPGVWASLAAPSDLGTPDFGSADFGSAPDFGSADFGSAPDFGSADFGSGFGGPRSAECLPAAFECNTWQRLDTTCASRGQPHPTLRGSPLLFIILEYC